MKTVITEFDCKMLIRCIENNPIGVRYCFDGGLYTVSVKDVKAMQNEFISKVPLIMTAPETLSLDDYTNLRLYVTDEFTGPGWNNEKLEPTEYGIELDLLLNKLSALAEIVEKEQINQIRYEGNFMSNMYIYGKIVFFRILTEEELINKAFDVIQKSIPYRFGVKFESNSPWDQYELRRKKIDLSDCCLGPGTRHALAFEITDDPLSNECFDMIGNVWIGQHGFIHAEKSRLPNLERFLGDILSLELVTGIELVTESVHGYGGGENTTYTTKIDEFVKTWSTAETAIYDFHCIIEK